MYDPDVAFVRRLEIFKAKSGSRSGQTLKVFFMVYDSSVQEQVYLAKLRREKEAFELLIREKSMMAISLDADGRVDPGDAQDMFWKRFEESSEAKKRRGGKAVIVDVREFRSALPFALFDQNLDVGMALRLTSPSTADAGSRRLCLDARDLRGAEKHF